MCACHEACLVQRFCGFSMYCIGKQCDNEQHHHQRIYLHTTSAVISIAGVKPCTNIVYFGPYLELAWGNPVWLATSSPAPAYSSSKAEQLEVDMGAVRCGWGVSRPLSHALSILKLISCHSLFLRRRASRSLRLSHSQVQGTSLVPGFSRPTRDRNPTLIGPRITARSHRISSAQPPTFPTPVDA